MRLVISSTMAAVLMSVTPALATDLYDDEDDRERVPGVHVQWSGPYTGARVGYGSADHGDYDDYDHYLGTSSEDINGAIGGFEVGYDQRVGRGVFGVFASYDFSGMETTITVFDSPEFGLEKNGEWSVGVRAGVLVTPEVLLYGLLAYTHTSYDIIGLDSDVYDFSDDEDLNGVSFGGGIELAATENIFFGLQYTHTVYSDEFDAIDDLDENKVMATLKVKLNKPLFQ